MRSPLGFKHGRMSSFATAALLAAPGAVVAGHDMHRCVEAFMLRAMFPPHTAPVVADVDRIVAVRVNRTRTPASLAEVEADTRARGVPMTAAERKLVGCS